MFGRVGEARGPSADARAEARAAYTCLALIRMQGLSLRRASHAARRQGSQLTERHVYSTVFLSSARPGGGYVEETQKTNVILPGNKRM